MLGVLAMLPVPEVLDVPAVDLELQNMRPVRNVRSLCRTNTGRIAVAAP